MDLAIIGGMQIIDVRSPVEARTWLRDNPSTSALAGNRFHNTRNAQTFVDMLYAAGAAEVLIANPDVDVDGHPYADTLLVRLPSDPGTRRGLERLCEEEGPGDVPPGDFTMDVGRYEIRLWWD